jgi:hypothetical protein
VREVRRAGLAFDTFGIRFLKNRDSIIESKIVQLVMGFSIGAIISYTIFVSSTIRPESAFMLMIFNFLFVPLTFLLDGSLLRKLLILLLGNFVGFVWNYVFSLLAYTAAAYFGDSFNTLYLILNPFANLIWIVSFWSMSLTVLSSKSKNRKIGD